MGSGQGQRCVALSLCSAVGPVESPDSHLLDDVLKKCVVGDGVDYQVAKQNQASLEKYLASLADVTPTDLSADEQKALFINAYNAATLLLVLEHWGPNFKSITDIPEEKRWKHRRWNIGGSLFSLDQIEHQVLRA
ncbi:MAG: DUF547 domain-containing protein, partial [Phycisphaerae bacterium]